MSIHPGTSFFDVVKHVQRTAAVLKNGLACLNRNESLFRVAAIPAEPQHFLLVVSLNHTIGDGFTFYKLCGMLDPAASVVSMNPVRQVGFSGLAAERIGPNHFNWLTTCPTLVGLLRSFCLWHPEEPEVRYVDQDYISKLKLESDTKVSTNDILTSHLLQKSGFGYGYMSINLRNRGLGANDSNAGNYVHRIHLAPERFLRPEGVRKSLAGPETLAPPGWWESMTTRHGLVSNWSHFFQEVSLPGSQHVAHMPVLPYPHPGFGLILIFKPSQNTLAVYYMIRDKEAFEDARSGVGRFEVPGQPMYILRPGASEDQGWLWIMGLSPDVLNHIRSSIESGSAQDLPDEPQKSTFASFLEMWKRHSARKGRVTKAPRVPSKKKAGKHKPQLGPSSALGYLDQLLRPLEVAPRVTLASFWHSKEVVEHVQREDLEGWIVLAGDAACGKPFYLGTNLNGHFQDSMSLLSAPWTRWPRRSQGTQDSEGQSPSEGMRDPFKRYVSEYRKRISESQGRLAVLVFANVPKGERWPNDLRQPKMLKPSLPSKLRRLPEEVKPSEPSFGRPQATTPSLADQSDHARQLQEMQVTLIELKKQLAEESHAKESLNGALAEARAALAESEKATESAQQQLREVYTRGAVQTEQEVDTTLQVSQSEISLGAGQGLSDSRLRTEAEQDFRQHAGIQVDVATDPELLDVAGGNPSQLRALQSRLEETQRQLEACLQAAVGPPEDRSNAGIGGVPSFSTEEVSINPLDDKLMACLDLRYSLGDLLDPPELLLKVCFGLWLILGFLLVDGQVCRVQVLTELEGEIRGSISGSGLSRSEGCAWHIFPGLNLRAIEFQLLEPATFVGSDGLIIYGSRNMRASTRIATFHKTNPIPAAMMLTGTSEAVLWLNGMHNESSIRLGYACRPFGARIGDTWFSGSKPLNLLVISDSQWQELLMQESQLMMRSELARRIRQNEAVRAQEQQVVASLEALPLEKWKIEGGRRRSTNECCLCLEDYGDEDMLRVLPCCHYFHQACIDKWFSANRFIPRSCPLCKRDPMIMMLPSAETHTDPEADQARPTFAGILSSKHCCTIFTDTAEASFGAPGHRPAPGSLDGLKMGNASCGDRSIIVRKNARREAALGGACFCGALFGLPGLILGGVGGALAVGDIDVQETCRRCDGKGRVELGCGCNTPSSVQPFGTPRGWHGRGGRTMRMYHGTTHANAQSIMENGFNPSSGGMLGQGVYLSADIEKAKRYGSSILVVEAKLGKIKKIDSQSHPMRTSWNSHGYDSAWVPAHCGMVHSGLTETCVFDPDRIRAAMGQLYAVLCLQTKAKSFLATKQLIGLRRARPPGRANRPSSAMYQASRPPAHRQSLPQALPHGLHVSTFHELDDEASTERRRWSDAPPVPPLPLGDLGQFNRGRPSTACEAFDPEAGACLKILDLIPGLDRRSRSASVRRSDPETVQVTPISYYEKESRRRNRALRDELRGAEASGLLDLAAQRGHSWDTIGIATALHALAMKVRDQSTSSQEILRDQRWQRLCSLSFARLVEGEARNLANVAWSLANILERDMPFQNHLAELVT
eukprot:s1358_g13.t1